MEKNGCSIFYKKQSYRVVCFVGGGSFGDYSCSLHHNVVFTVFNSQGSLHPSCLHTYLTLFEQPFLFLPDPPALALRAMLGVDRPMPNPSTPSAVHLGQGM